MVATETFDLGESAEAAAETARELVENPGVIKSYFQSIGPKVLTIGIQIVLAVIILLIGTRIIKWLVGMIRKGMQKSRLEAGVVSFLCSLIKYVLYFVLIMLILAQFGVTTGSVVAVLGSAGLTIGLALQGSLANFAGGVLILLLKPFVLGDYIIDGSGGCEGTVSEISIFYTKLLTVDNKVIQIPNGSLSNATITNVSHMETRRIDLVIGVSYESDLSKVKAVLQKVAQQEEAILQGEPVDIYVSELAESSVNMGFRVWVKTQDYWTVRWRLTENIKNAFDENGISIPFPQMDVQLKK